MNGVAIPDWTPSGILPPVDALDPTSAVRSPYRVNLTDVVLRFATSDDRCAVIDGLLRYRAALRGVGLAEGFQWLDGSFLEHVEQLESRPPGDIDLVTFYHLPPGESQQSLITSHPRLFDRGQIKATYRVDGFFTHLGSEPERLVERSAYWYGLWSHRRDFRWKGFVEVGLGALDDGAARSLLSTRP